MSCLLWKYVFVLRKCKKEVSQNNLSCNLRWKRWVLFSLSPQVFSFPSMKSTPNVASSVPLPHANTLAVFGTGNRPLFLLIACAKSFVLLGLGARLSQTLTFHSSSVSDPIQLCCGSFSLYFESFADVLPQIMLQKRQSCFQVCRLFLWCCPLENVFFAIFPQPVMFQKTFLVNLSFCIFLTER